MRLLKRMLDTTIYIIFLDYHLGLHYRVCYWWSQKYATEKSQTCWVHYYWALRELKKTPLPSQTPYLAKPHKNRDPQLSAQSELSHTSTSVIFLRVVATYQHQTLPISFLFSASASCPFPHWLWMLSRSLGFKYITCCALNYGLTRDCTVEWTSN
jgi:hypothetical protein